MDSSTSFTIFTYVTYAATTVILVLGVAAGWRSFMAGYRRGRNPDRFRRVQAQVIDVTLQDSEQDRSRVLYYRVLLRFRPEHGELVVVDKVLEPTPAQKDMLLPDHWLTIVYEVDEPDRFEIDFAEGVGTGEAPPIEAPKIDAKREAPSLYGPQ